MALYRTGTAAMDAQGVITGTGTKWREPLSLIRTGATIVFLDQPVIKLAVISEIVSNTEMKAISTDGAVVPDGKYVILLNDSLTVDGMAQDVAETLRYYQSKETVIEEAIEFFKNFDLKTLQDLVNKVNADAQQVANDKAATEQLKNETQQIKDSAVSETQQIKDAAVNETNQIKADTDAIKTQTQQIKDSAVSEIGSIKNESVNARDAAKESQLAAEQSKIAADSAKAGAETARDEARQWAQQVNPENILHKDQNLNDIPDKNAAKIALFLERFNQGDAETLIQSPDKIKYLTVGNDGWGYWNTRSQQFIPLGVQQGGTGANNVTQAKTNFGLDRFVQLSSGTQVIMGGYSFNLLNNGEWGVTQDGVAGWLALGLDKGGTGANNASQARKNLELTEWGVHKTMIAKFGEGSSIDLISVNCTVSVDPGTAIKGTRPNSVFPEIADEWFLLTTECHSDPAYRVQYASYFTGTWAGSIFNRVCINNSWSSWRQISGVSGLIKDPVPNRATFLQRGKTAGGSGAVCAGIVEGSAWTTWRDRSTGVRIEMDAFDNAFSVWKAVKLGADWPAGMDVLIWQNNESVAMLHVKGADYVFNSNGTASAVSWVSTSDIRLKTHLKEILSAKEKVKSLQGYTYYKRNNLVEDEHSYYGIEAGLIAQDLQSVLPEAVHSVNGSDNVDYLAINYGGVTALLVNAINEMIDDSDKQNKTIQAQQEEIKELKNEIAEMKAAIAEMQAMFVQIAK